MSTWLDTKQTNELIKQLEKINYTLTQTENALIILTERLSYVLTEAGVKIKK